MEAVLHGPSGRTVLGPGVMTIGRASDNQLVVIDRTASSHHAEIRPGVQGYSLIDVGSTNGTFVNGRILDRQVLHLLQDSDEIRIGSATFVFEASSPAFRGPLEQEYSLEDDTVQLSVSEYRAPGRAVGVQPGDYPPATYSSYRLQEQLADNPLAAHLQLDQVLDTR